MHGYPARSSKKILIRMGSVHLRMHKEVLIEIFHILKWKMFDGMEVVAGESFCNEIRRALSRGVNRRHVHAAFVFIDRQDV